MGTIREEFIAEFGDVEEHNPELLKKSYFLHAALRLANEMTWLMDAKDAYPALEDRRQVLREECRYASGGDEMLEEFLQWFTP